MADFGKDQNLIFDDGNGVELADFRAFPAMVAFLFIHLWNRKADRESSSPLGGEKKMQVGLFHITIQELNILQG
jgi:hypothetical protein